MRYQIRLENQNMPGLTRELARACWNAVDALLPARPGTRLYRSLYRALRTGLRARVQAFRYCGAARSCEQCLAPTELGGTTQPERFPPEPSRIRIFLTGPEAPPSVLVTELLRGALKAVVRAVPRTRIKGLARFLRRQIEKILRDKVAGSEPCGHLPLCGVNEPYDAWDRRDEINLLVRKHA